MAFDNNLPLADVKVTAGQIILASDVLGYGRSPLPSLSLKGTVSTQADTPTKLSCRSLR